MIIRTLGLLVGGEVAADSLCGKGGTTAFTAPRDMAFRNALLFTMGVSSLSVAFEPDLGLPTYASPRGTRLALAFVRPMTTQEPTYLLSRMEKVILQIGDGQSGPCCPPCLEPAYT
jgi:hypothetical protein